VDSSSQRNTRQHESLVLSEFTALACTFGNSFVLLGRRTYKKHT
ncbi:MAG: hypothetical protein ACI85I_002024, partial [Arenicella sp.]